MNKQESTFNKEQAFLSDLADLLDSHDVAISSFDSIVGDRSNSEVVFQFSGTSEGIQHNFHTGRWHNAGHEVRGFGNHNTLKKTESVY